MTLPEEESWLAVMAAFMAWVYGARDQARGHAVSLAWVSGAVELAGSGGGTLAGVSGEVKLDVAAELPILD